jgi:benzoate membrane transport protein
MTSTTRTATLAPISAAIVAALVGIAGALAVVLEAARAVGATPAQTTSWVTAICLAMGLTSAFLSFRHRMPIITAWSTPGAAVIAASGGATPIEAAVGAFLLAGGLIVATGLIAPLERAVARIPIAVAAGMLAGVLFRFVIQMVEAATTAPLMVLPLVLLFLVVRPFNPGLSMLAVIGAALGIATWNGSMAALPPLQVSELVWVAPRFEVATLIGIGVPLYLVTMASQNLPGAAVLRAAGYPPPLSSALVVTGGASMLIAPLTGHTVNLAAITAAICTGPDAHPDPARRWHAGIAYGIVYCLLAVGGASLVALFAAFPDALIKTIAGLGLLGALAGALGAAVGEERNRFAAVAAFAVTAAGLSAGGIGAAFWGLVAGLAVSGIDSFARRIAARE